MTRARRLLLPALIIAIAISFTPILNFAGLGADQAYAAAKMKAPKSVKIKVVSQTALKISWGKVKGAKGYTVYQKKGSKFKAIKTLKGKSLTVKKLKAGTKYTFYVKAFKKKGKKKVYGKASKKVSAKTKAAAVAEPTAVCKNGKFVGTKETSGVVSFKGIPYAKAPTGELRWKAPQRPDDSNATFQAKEFGHPAVQANYPLPDPAHGEEAVSWVFDGSKYQVSEDCLTLNVWTKDLNPAEKKPVMVWFHGGGFVVGSTTNGAYQLDNFAKNEDMVMVSCNYRLGAFGSLDLSGVPEGEKYKTSDFKDSQNLALLDDIQALRWIKENIAAFGGDPNNITIFGNSAGAADVTVLTTANVPEIQSGDLFQRVIAQSGSLSLMVPNMDMGEKKPINYKTARKNQATKLMALTGCKNLDELMALSEEQLIRAYTGYYTNKNRIVDMDFVDPAGEEHVVGCMAYDNEGCPVYGDDGGLLPYKDPYEAVLDGAGKNIDVLYGSNQNEWNYWIYEMAAFAPPKEGSFDPIPLLEQDKDLYTFGMIPLEKMGGELALAVSMSESDGDIHATLSEDEMKNNVDQFMKLPRVAKMRQTAKERTEAEWKGLISAITYWPEEAIPPEWIAAFKENEETCAMNTELYNDLVFRAPAIKAAENHATAAKTKEGKGKTYMYYWAKETDQPYQGASHASEISYVMGNFNHTVFSGNVDKGLSKQMQDMWANFARTGDPSANGVQWDQYDGTNRATMTIGLDGGQEDTELKMVNAPFHDQYQLVEPLLKYHLK
ncbi:MAG: carboxylesterase family protein [Firmicutes bacterium]|nr:carboxylesterase family protein [Bacillota bacterium]